MNKGKTRKEQHVIQKEHYKELSEAQPRECAAKAFKNKPYEVHDVPSYIMAKYGVKKE